jgi:hypothetical protein
MSTIWPRKVHEVSRSVPTGIVSVLVALFVGTATSGCSVIGLAMGAKADATKPDYSVIPDWEITTMKPGSPVRVELETGRVEGYYRGTELVPGDEYAARYAKAASDTLLGFTPPPLREPLWL